MDPPSDWLQRCAIAVQSAALDDSLWPDALAMLRSVFDAPAAGLETWDHRHHSNWSFVTSGVDEGGMQRIHELYPDTNPRYEANSGIREGEVTYDYRHFDEPQLSRMDFVRAMEEHAGVRYFMAGSVLRTGQHFSIVSLHREGRHGHFSKQHTEMLQTFLPILKLAVQTSILVGEQSALASLDLTENSPTAIILVNSAARVLFANRSARALEASRKLLLLNDKVALSCPRDGRLLTEHIGRAIDGQAGGFRTTGDPDHHPLDVIVVPVPISFHALLPVRPRAAVLIRDPAATQPLNPFALQALFGFSSREIELAQQLQTGMDLDQIAGVLGMSIATARVHLKNMLRKTDTHSQRALVSRLSAYR